MHPSWLDAAALVETTRVLDQRILNQPLPDWWIKWVESLPESSDETSAASTEATTPTEPPVTG
jgi:hypothetical protein